MQNFPLTEFYLLYVTQVMQTVSRNLIKEKKSQLKELDITTKLIP